MRSNPQNANPQLAHPENEAIRAHKANQAWEANHRRVSLYIRSFERVKIHDAGRAGAQGRHVGYDSFRRRRCLFWRRSWDAYAREHLLYSLWLHFSKPVMALVHPLVQDNLVCNCNQPEHYEDISAEVKQEWVRIYTHFVMAQHLRLLADQIKLAFLPISDTTVLIISYHR